MRAQEQISKIDTAIAANRRALMARLHVDPGMSAHAWQNAWDRCPDLHARECGLYRERGIAQQLADHEAEKAYRQEQRRFRARMNKRDMVTAR